MLFQSGGKKQAFAVPFVGSSVAWSLLGEKVTATLESADCSTVGPGSAACEASSSEFHCCTAIDDCSAVQKFALYAGSQLRLGERVRVVDGDGAPGKVLSLGSSIMQPEAEVGELLSGGDLLVGERATVLGLAALKGTAVGAVDHVQSVRRAPIEAPNLGAFSRAFAGEGGAALALRSDSNQELAPGSYGSVVVDGSVRLRSGTYYFSQLTVGSSSRVAIDSSSGPVVIRVASNADLAGTVHATTGGLLVELNGPGSVTLNQHLNATIIAPEGEVRVAAGVTIRGAIYADVISIAEDVTIVQELPVMPR